MTEAPIRFVYESPCRHLDAYLRGDDALGIAWCPTCRRSVQVYLVFNSWLERLRELEQKAKEP